MANELDEITGPVNKAGRDINVIDKQLPVTVGIGSTIFEICLWIVPIAVAALIPYLYGLPWAVAAAGIVPGLIWWYIKLKAENYLQQLQQKIQAEASTVGNCYKKRAEILKNAASAVKMYIKHESGVMENIAALRSGIQPGEDLNKYASQVDAAVKNFSIQLEKYPELQADLVIADFLQQNIYTESEIAAARDVYNNRVYQWNRDIYDWPAKQIVAAKKGYHTRVPFIISEADKQLAQSDFLN